MRTCQIVEPVYQYDLILQVISSQSKQVYHGIPKAI